MEVLLGCAAFAGAVLLVCIVRSVLIGRLGWTRRAGTRVAIGAPLALAVIFIGLALAGANRGGGMAGLALPFFSLIALVVGGLGVALSKLVRGEFSSPRE